ncbi:Hypothetical protein ACGLYG10_1169 [Actinomyces glycerinitolerans]|uniref:Uncharacterized protein n=1 Tax=Actinomyces glycerinitolerans TaxID=1892869 RepID=A0A1M4RZ21_9ACTO|nr:Hypothetical protein ACGLYG10_1169 [Actinomyces glycerinitolerans]
MFRDELLDSAFTDHVAAVHKNDSVSNNFSLAHQVRTEEHGLIGMCKPRKKVPQPLNSERVESVGRLVEYHHLGIA